MGKFRTALGEELKIKYSNLIRMRGELDALKSNHTEFKLINSQDKVIVYWRISDEDEAVVVANFDEQTHYVDVEFPNSGQWVDGILKKLSILTVIGLVALS